MPSAARITANLGRIGADLAELATLAGEPKTMAARVASLSAWSVGEHVEHLLVSDELILDGLKKIDSPTAEAGSGGPNLLGRICLWTGWIPRGRGRAPQVSLPQGASREDILRRLRILEQGFAALAGSAESLAASRATVPHPVFGRLGPAAWLRFVEIHHHHHRKIVDDVLRAADLGEARSA